MTIGFGSALAASDCAIAAAAAITSVLFDVMVFSLR